MLMIDDTKSHVMKAHLVDDGYVILAWPKNLSLKWLDLMSTQVNFQIDTFRRSARRKEYGEVEYESWFARASNAGEQQ